MEILNKNRQSYWFLLILIFFVSCKGKNRTTLPENNKIEIVNNTSLFTKNDTLTYNNAPNNITRNIIQDKSGNIWFATFEGMIKYDGNSFTNITKDVSLSRFFSVLEDSKGNLWFGSIGSGAYSYDGKEFQNFTTNDGLINNEIVCIYEDKSGDIWFGANGGVSRYDGKSFRNYVINNNSIREDNIGIIVPNLQRPPNGVNSIIEDKNGKYWLATRGNTFIYDGKTFTTVKQNDIPFSNVRSVIEDKEGNIWLGGNNGLWLYDGITFSQITRDFVGHIYEDKKGNIWTSSATSNNWALSRYDSMSSNDTTRIVTELKTGEGMFFGILEDSDGNIWSGTLNGVYRYDGKVFEDFR